MLNKLLRSYTADSVNLLYFPNAISSIEMHMSVPATRADCFCQETIKIDAIIRHVLQNPADPLANPENLLLERYRFKLLTPHTHNDPHSKTLSTDSPFMAYAIYE